jgi:hypothetical protein
MAMVAAVAAATPVALAMPVPTGVVTVTARVVTVAEAIERRLRSSASPGNARSQSAAAKTEMISRTPTLAEWLYGMVRLPCGLASRRGQYRKGTLIRRFGGDVKMPDLRHLIARCPHKDAPGAACGVYYADLREP